MHLHRSPINPLISPKDIVPSNDHFNVVGVFNAGAIYHAGETVLLLRVAEQPKGSDPNVLLLPKFDIEQGRLVTSSLKNVERLFNSSDSRFVRRDRRKARTAESQALSTATANLLETPDVRLTTISHLRIARSKDGQNFDIQQTPALVPQSNFEKYGIEDPRIVTFDGQYFITYSAISDEGICAGLASAVAFDEFKRHGVIFPPHNKDVVLFPKKIGGKFYALHRPYHHAIGRAAIWIGESIDLHHWGNHRPVFSLGSRSWDQASLGSGPPPIETNHGWLLLYNGSDNKRCCIGAALLAKDEPWRVLSRTAVPLLTPEQPYETLGFFPNTVSSCGVQADGEDLVIYYGGADTYLASARCRLEEIVYSLRESAQA